MSNKREEGVKGLDALPEAALQRVADKLLEGQNPLTWDRLDILRTACSITAAGKSPGAQRLAKKLFKHLSPHLGEPLPLGVTQDSSLPQIKEALKSWHLPYSKANKPGLLRRLLDQVEDSEEDAQGTPPRYCQVSAATRAELAGWNEQGISGGKAKEIFMLTKAQIESLPPTVEHNITVYKRRDLKQKALAVHGSWAGALKRKRESDGHSEATEQRLADLRAVLLSRGSPVESLEVVNLADDSFRAPFDAVWGAKQGAASYKAADWIEQFDFLLRGPPKDHYQAALASTSWEPSEK
ncbi:hypothetical protein ABPG75_007693 [Micractinium tetrahymenae]